MKIIMNEGFEITEEIITLSKGYDVYYHYIDNYSQMKQAEQKNNQIMDKLKLLGVKNITN